MATNFFQIFQHLLPTGIAWRTTTNKVLRRLFEGLAPAFERSREFADHTWRDLTPATTQELEEWEKQFGLEPSSSTSVADRRLALAAEWAATGGQSPGYIQGVLQTAGFDLYVHEWWESGPPYVPHDPRDYTTIPLIGSRQCAPAAFASQPQCKPRGPDAMGDGFDQAQCDQFLSNDPHYFDNKDLTRRPPPPIPADPAYWPYFIYIGGETFPDEAIIPSDRLLEFQRLILKLRPLQNWIVVLGDGSDTGGGGGGGGSGIFDNSFDASFQ